MRTIQCVFSLVLLTVTAQVQSDTPYAGQQQRPIKALSEQQINGYRSGQGMGYAKAAELNHYPGPRHVLDLAEALELTDQQIKDSQAIFDRMKSEAIALGEQLVDAERTLDHDFAETTITAESLQSQITRIGELEARIRLVHLNAHLAQKAILSEQQILNYDEQRGYGAGHDHHHGHSH